MKTKLMKALTTLRLFEKRLLRTPAFLTVLALIVLLSIGFSALLRDGGNVVSVAYYAPSGEEKIDEIVRALESEPLLAAKRCESEEEAKNAVQNGTVDAAWIFFDDFDERSERFLDDGEPIVRCYERENSVYLNLAREKLFSLLFKPISRDIFAREMERLSGVEPSAESVAEYYEQHVKDDELILFYSLEDELRREEDFMTSPLRGLLLLLILCGGVASAMTQVRDEKSGVFLTVGRARAERMRLLTVALPVLHLALAVYFALAILGQLTNPAFDALLTLTYALAVCGLCSLLASLFRSGLALSVSMLLLVILTLASTPVFINVRALRPVAVLLPGYYHLVGAQDKLAALWLTVYACVCFALSKLCARRAIFAEK